MVVVVGNSHLVRLNSTSSVVLILCLFVFDGLTGALMVFVVVVVLRGLVSLSECVCRFVCFCGLW